jgi:hypothetical protein
MSTPKKYRATAYITLPVVAVFDDDGVHHLEVQAEAALRAEAQVFYCLADPDPELGTLHIDQLSVPIKSISGGGTSTTSRVEVRQ